MNVARRLVILLVSAAPVMGVGWLSRVPYDSPGSDSAVLRMSWRLRGAKEEECRPRTQAELDALPLHMRTPEICEGHLVAYRLYVQIGDRPVESQVFVPQGAKGDRPVFVMKEAALEIGPQRIRISFAPIDDDDDDRDDHGDGPAGKGGYREEDDADDADDAAMYFDGIVTGRGGVVELITMDAAGRLVWMSGD